MRKVYLILVGVLLLSNLHSGNLLTQRGAPPNRENSQMGNREAFVCTHESPGKPRFSTWRPWGESGEP